MVSESVIKAMMEIAALSFVMPLAIIILWKIRCKQGIIASLTGALVFITFGGILKSVPNMLFLSVDSPVSRFIKSNIWIYAIYAGLMAGIFEELGRFISFKLFLGKNDYRETAIAYGFGHGGIECMMVLGFSMLQNFTYAQVINAGQMEQMIGTLEDESSKEVFRELQEAIINLSVSECVWEGIERISAMILQVALSVLVFYAAKTINKKYFLVIAIALHALIDVFAALNQQQSVPLAVVEIIIFVYALAVGVFAYKIYGRLPKLEKAGIEKKNWAYARTKYQDKDDKPENGQVVENNDNKTT